MRVPGTQIMSIWRTTFPAVRGHAVVALAVRSSRRVSGAGNHLT